MESDDNEILLCLNPHEPDLRGATNHQERARAIIIRSRDRQRFGVEMRLKKSYGKLGPHLGRSCTEPRLSIPLGIKSCEIIEK